MKRRSIFQSLAGLIGAKSLQAEPVSPRRSAGEVGRRLADGAASNPLFNDTRYIMVVGKDGKMGMYSYVPKTDNRVTITRVTN